MSVAGTIAKNTLFNFVATISDVLVNFVVGIVLARSLGIEQYGLYSFLTWFLGLAALAANLGVGSMAARFIADALGRENREEPKGIVRLTLVFRGIAALVVSSVILIFSGFWTKVFAETHNQIYFVFLAVALLPNAMNYVLIGIFSGFQKYEYNAYLILGSNPLRAILLIVLAFLGFGVKELLIASIASWIVGMVIGVFLLRRLVPLKALLSSLPLEPATRRSALKYSLTMISILVLNYLLWEQAEVLFLGLYRPVEEVGFYTLASRLPSMAVTLIPSVFGAVLLPAIAEQFGKGDIEKVRRIYLTSARYLMMLAIPLAAGGIALSRPIINLLYGPAYTPAVILMQIVFVPFAAASIGNAAGSVILGINQPSFVLKVGSLLALLNVGLNLWLIPRYGMLGAAIASSVPRILALPIYIIFASRKVSAAWPLVDTIKISAASCFMGLTLFALQTHLSAALGVILGILLGVVLYAIAILVFKVLHSQDLNILKGIQDSLPPALRKHYAVFIELAGRLVIAKPAKSDSDLG